MGLIKNEHGVFHVRRKVPKALEAATARVLGGSKARVSWLKATLATKDEKRAKVLAKPVMMKFDRVLAQAEALLVERPVRTELTETEIRRMADYHFAAVLAEDDRLRQAGLREWSNEDRKALEHFEVDARSEHDLVITEILDDAEDALAANELDYVKEEAEALLDVFQLRLGPDLMYREAVTMVHTMKMLMARGIPSLPIHDGIIVPTYAAGEAVNALIG